MSKIKLIEKLKKIASYAYHSTQYYKKIFDRANIDINLINTIEDFTKLPIVSPLDLIKYGADFSSKEAEIYRITSSSGTSNNPKTLYRSAEDTNYSVINMIKLFKMAGLKNSDRLIIDQPFDLAHLGYLSLEACKKMTIMAIPIGLSSSEERIIKFMEKYSPISIFSSPSRMTKISSIIREKSCNKIEIDKILLAGEKVSKSQLSHITDTWNTIPHNLYGSEELDGLAGSCENGCLHFLNEDFYLELINSTNNNEGEAVITSLYSQGTPLIRYHLGDRIRLNDYECPCGSKNQIIEITGRIKGSISLYNGVTLHQYQIDNALKILSYEIDFYQIICRNTKDNNEEVEIVFDGSKQIDLHKVENALWNCSIDLSPLQHTKALRFKISNDPKKMIITRRGKTPSLIDLRR